MSHNAVNDVILYGTQWSHAKFRVAIVVAQAINSKTNDFPIWTSHILETSGVARSKVYEILKELEAEGVFTRTQQYKQGNQIRSLYTWTWKPEKPAKTSTAAKYVPSGDTNVPSGDTNVPSGDANVPSGGHYISNISKVSGNTRPRSGRAPRKNTSTYSHYDAGALDAMERAVLAAGTARLGKKRF